MKKVRNVFVSLILMTMCVFALTGCGVDMEKLKGNWTVDTIDGKSVAEYAAEKQLTEEQACFNINISDEELVQTFANGVEAKYKVVVRSNGIECEQDGKLAATYIYENDELTSSVDFGAGEAKVVMKKGTTDFANMNDETLVEEEAAEEEFAEEEAAEEEFAEEEAAEEEFAEEEVAEEEAAE